MNLRPQRPERCALPGCATPRIAPVGPDATSDGLRHQRVIDYRSLMGRASSAHASGLGVGRVPTAGTWSRGGLLAGVASLLALASCEFGGIGSLGFGGSDGEPRLIFGSEGNLVQLSADGRSRKVILAVPSGAVARDPAWSPDGKQVVYAYTPPLTVSRGASPALMLPVTDLNLLDVATGSTRQLLVHDREGGAYDRPTWSPDGRTIYANHVAPILDGSVVRDTIEEVVRIAVGSGLATPEVVVREGFDAALSPDGRYLAWVRRTIDGRAIEVGKNDGLGARTVVSPTLADNASWPRFSRDGSKLVFSAASPFTPVPTVTPLPRRAWLGARVASARGRAHGVPMDLFAVGVDGTGFSRLTTLGEDSPSASWSPDGTRLALVSGGGIYVLTPSSKDLRVVDAAGGHGAIDWR